MKTYLSLFPFFFSFLLSCMEKQIIPKTEQSRLSLRMLMQNTECKGLIEKVYFDAFNFVGKIENFSLQHEGNKTLMNLITSVRSVKEKGITADHMSIYAYNQCDWKTDSLGKQRIPLFFGCLKQYQRGALQKKEVLPVTYPQSEFQKKYPAYYTLVHNLIALFKASNLKDLLIFLYSKKKCLFIIIIPKAPKLI